MNASPLAAFIEFFASIELPPERNLGGESEFLADILHTIPQKLGEKEIHHISICSMTDFISLSKVVLKYWGKKVCHSLYVWGIFFPQRLKSVWKKSILIPIMDQIPCNFFCKTPQTNPCRLYWVKVWREMNVYWILWWHSIASRKEVELGYYQILG